MLITPQNLSAMFTVFSLMYQSAFTTAEVFWRNLAMTTPSTTETNTYTWMEKIPKMREWIGPRVLQNLVARNPVIVSNRLFELTIEVPKQKILDDQYGIYTPAASMMGLQAAKWPDDLVQQAVLDTTTVGYDGVTYWNASHPVNLDNSGQGVYSNIADSDELTLANYGTAKAAMRSYIGADGRRIGARGSLLVVSPSKEEVGRQILQSQYYPRLADGGTLGHGDVAMSENIWKGSAELLVIDDLEDQPHTWFLLDNTKPIMPCNFQLRQAPTFAYLTNPTDPNVFFNRHFVMGVEALGNAVMTLPFLGYRGGYGLN